MASTPQTLVRNGSAFRIEVNPSAKGTRTGHVQANGGDSRPDKDQKEDNGHHSPPGPAGEMGTDKELFRFVKWVAHRPRLCFGIALGVHVFFLVLSGLLVVSGYNLFPANFESLPMELHDEPWLKRDLAWTERDEYSDRVSRDLPSSKYPTWERAFTKESLLLFYDAGSDNVFTKSNLQLFNTIENRLTNVTRFPDYCQMTQAGACTQPVSVLRFFDGTYSSVDPVFNDPTYDNITAVLYAASVNNETKAAFTYALGKGSTVSSSYVSSTLTRSLIPLGWPLAGGYSEKEAVDILAEFMAEHMLPVLEEYLDVSQVDFVFYNSPLMFYEVTQQAFLDMALALGSMVFIFCFILFHTRSLWVTCLAELSILCSFVETNFIYRVVIGFEYFGYFHVLAMFIILGIGADDLFVFWDAWQATGLNKYPSLAHRLNDAYGTSIKSMLVTSITTMTAFLANAMSPLLATRSFGVFAAILIGIDYLSVITFFPTIVVFYHVYFEDKPHPCCCCWSQKKKGDDNDSETEKENAASTKYASKNDPLAVPIRLVSTPTRLQNGKNSLTTFHGGGSTVSPEKPLARKDSSLFFRTNTAADLKQKSQAEKREGDGPERKPSRLVIFFRDYYFAFVTHRIARWVIVVLLLGCLVFFAVSASNLEPDNEQIQLYTESHHYSRAIKHNNYGFVENDMDRTITIFLVWGLRETDLDSCHFSSIECAGTRAYDSSFDASTEAAQQAFVTICDTLFNFTDAQVSAHGIKRDLVTGELQIACFPRNMETFLKVRFTCGEKVDSVLLFERETVTVMEIQKLRDIAKQNKGKAAHILSMKDHDQESRDEDSEVSHTTHSSSFKFTFE